MTEVVARVHRDIRLGRQSAVIGLVQPNNGQDGEAEHHVVPELNSGEAQSQRGDDESNSHKAIDRKLQARKASPDSDAVDARQDQIFDRYMRTWTRVMLDVLRVDLTILGELPPPAAGPRLVVSNHRSAVDIPILITHFGGSVLSRGDIESWPILGLAAFVAVVAVAVGVGAYPFTRRLTRRLEALRDGVERFGAGDLSARVAVAGRDELAVVAGSFNRASAVLGDLLVRFPEDGPSLMLMSRVVDAMLGKKDEGEVFDSVWELPGK